MTDIKVTQSDIDTVRQIRLSDQVWYQQDRVARHRIEAQRPLIKALERLMDSIMERTKGDYAGSWDNALAAIKQAKGG